MDHLRTATADRADLVAVFADIWAELIANSPFDEALTWAESGVDSLKGLIFWLRLEQVLGRPLSYDLMTREMTLGDLIDVIASPEPLHVPAPSGSQRLLGAPVFLVPALFGDEPILADFRRSLAGQLAFDTLALPDIDHPAARLSDMAWIVDHLVRQIIERRPDGPLHIAGYSLGCVMAFEAANRLIAMGRDVRLVCLLDPPFNFGPRAREVAELAALEPPLRTVGKSLRLITKEEGPRQYGVRIAFGALVRFGALELARRLVLATGPLHGARINTLRRMRLIAEMRGRALLRWRPMPCPAPVLLVVSDEMSLSDPVRSWAPLCPQLTVQRAPGNHRQIFEPAALELLNPALLAAIACANEARRAAAAS
jgi:thioesterase domain-containing protein